ncbi:MAG: N-acetylmuramoyl-L-alanine amidase [Vulcanimicrobiaceae bacterium]
MSWINRYGVRIGSALALLFAILGVSRVPVAAQQRAAYVFDGKRISFTHLVSQNGRPAIGINDPGLKALLNDLGATVTWQPNERYVLFTTAEPIVVSFAIGDSRYDVGPITQQAPFAPYVRAGEAFVPFEELVRSLGLAPQRDGNDIVLQPQLASIEVQSASGGTKIVAHAGIPLDAHVVSDTNGKVVLAFEGVGTTLERTRRVQANGLREIDIQTEGSARNPRTLVTLVLAPGATHGPPATDDQRDFAMGLNGASVGQPIAENPAPAQPQSTPTEQPSPQPVSPADQSTWGASPPAQPGAVTVTAVNGSGTPDGFQVNVAVNGNASYEWHRLRPPDNRWYVDIHNASLGMPPSDQNGSGPVQSVRVRQAANQTVRVALSLADYDLVDVHPSDSGLTINVSNGVADINGTEKSGSGFVGSNAVANAAPAGAPPADNGGWKFAPRPSDQNNGFVAQNPRLIVIDPGHGGSDAGTVHGGLSEKMLALDMAKRLRTILIARGWQVMMTRDTDKDVYGPYDSAHDELQARDDIANKNGARMFVSIHVNGFINAGPRGVTTYYSKPIDSPLATNVQRRLAKNLGTADDGTVKSHLYVTLHSTMPAVLVETAFLTNPDDYAKLASPDWRQKVAESIADGIGDYAGSPAGSEQDPGQ